MAKRIKQTTFIGELWISKENYEQLLAWAQTLREINFIAFGKGRKILEVVRLTNTSRYPFKYACWNEKVSNDLIKEKKRQGFKKICTGHSHPRKANNQHPSLMDIDAVRKGCIELIVFPPKNEIRAWKIQHSLHKTLQSEIKINCNPV